MDDGRNLAVLEDELVIWERRVVSHPIENFARGGAGAVEVRSCPCWRIDVFGVWLTVSFGIIERRAVAACDFNRRIFLMRGLQDFGTEARCDRNARGIDWAIFRALLKHGVSA